jgi:hypothetical protein
VGIGYRRGRREEEEGGRRMGQGRLLASGPSYRDSTIPSLLASKVNHIGRFGKLETLGDLFTPSRKVSPSAEIGTRSKY